MRLIDADKWASYYAEERNQTPTTNDYDAGQNDALDRVDSWMEEQPTVDAVPVVRCEDCQYLFNKHGEYCCSCHSGMVRIDKNSFCSHGIGRKK